MVWGGLCVQVLRHDQGKIIINPMYEDRRSFETPKSNKIYISNLSYSTTEDELRKLFEEFGQITDVILKQKETITFAFVQFSSPNEAEAAIAAKNGKTVAGLEIKVQFARGGDRRNNFQNRGRGGSFGDRGGYQNRSYEGGDRPPRRDFGDRPRGCFNCGEEGHMIRDCPQPRKPREFNNAPREGGYETKRYGDDNRGDRGGDRGDRGGYNSRPSYGSRGGDRGYGDKGSRNRSRSRSNDNKDNKRRHRSPSSGSR